MTTLRGDRPAAVRRVGYLTAAVVDAALLYAVNLWPGWQAVPFLTGDTRQVLALVNLSLVAGLVANLVFVVYDAPWCRLAGDVVTTGIGLAVLVTLWQVFPFDFHRWAFDWPLLVRVVLVVTIVGASMGMVFNVASLLRTTAKGAAGNRSSDADS